MPNPRFFKHIYLLLNAPVVSVHTVNTFQCNTLWISIYYPVCFYLSRLRLAWDALVLEPLETGVGISPFSDGLKPSLMDTGRGAGPDGSWITMTSSLLCWPRCSLAKSKPFTLGVCSYGHEQTGIKVTAIQALDRMAHRETSRFREYI